MNKQNEKGIGWCDYTWSPLVGCKNACFYCYSKRLNDRFKWLKDFTKPKFYPERLKEPYELKKPSKIFVCSMADLFGDWVDGRWVLQILDVIRDNPQHTFQFLTKNPDKYLEFIFPKNCWLGITIDGTEDYRLSRSKISRLKLTNNYKFISFEPLLGNVSRLNLSKIDLVIVGAMTGAGVFKPEKGWINSIKHPNIFYKNNIKKYLVN